MSTLINGGIVSFCIRPWELPKNRPLPPSFPGRRRRKGARRRGGGKGSTLLYACRVTPDASPGDHVRIVPDLLQEGSGQVGHGGVDDDTAHSQGLLIVDDRLVRRATW